MDNRIREAFQEVRADESLKQSTKDFLARNIYQKPAAHRLAWRKWAAAAACFVLFIFGGWMLYFLPVTTVSVDVNPSLELGINRFERVVSVKGYNDDGKALAETLDIRYMDYTDALNAILDGEALSSYLEDGADVSITVAGKNAAACQRMLENVASSVADGRSNVYCRQGSGDSVDQAHACGLSVGKYLALLELQALDPDITAEDVHGLSMKEIRQWIQELEGQTDVDEDAPSETQAADPSCTNMESGSGHHPEGHGNGYGSGNGNGSGRGKGQGMRQQSPQ